MDPNGLAEQVEERYRRYLKTTFYFRDRVLRDSFEQALKDAGHLSKGPYLEATPVFKRGQTPRSLFEKLLGSAPHEGFLAALRTGSLHLHQEEAIRRIFEGRNVVVATGTGSGKTEAFLYPVLLHLYQEFSQSTLGNGVRALVLYPMNALANDQRERLGAICALLENHRSPFRFTFGQYTGDTPDNRDDYYRNAGRHIDRRYAGELVLREEMRKTPPHILLTNYSMLEYLLLRPQDSELFDNGQAKQWTFLILDEAHQYRGSKGIEMGMLLRRLKRRLREGGQWGEFRCIATSASLAGGTEDRKSVATFATQLFDVEFREEDVIFGETEPPPEVGSRSFATKVYPVLYQALQSSSVEARTELTQIASDLQMPVFPNEELPKAVGRLLQQDNRVIRLQRRITSEPTEVCTIADDVFDDLPQLQRAPALSELIELVLKSVDPASDTPLLSARYHLFLRSLEGAFVAYWPEKKVYLDRRALLQDGIAFEAALCRECGQHYFVGKLKDGKLREAMRDPGHDEFGADFFRPVETEEVKNHEADGGKQLYWLCIRCGEMWQFKLGAGRGRCGHGSSIVVVKEESSSEGEDQIPKCGVCGYRAPDPVREVVHGTDGPHAVIATTLHQTLPSDRNKVLAFADGRQEAAFFAWYLQHSYEEIRNRNLILQSVQRLAVHAAEGLSLGDLTSGLRDLFKETHVFDESRGDIELRRAAWLALYREFLTDEPRISLDGVGLIHWSIKWPKTFRIPEILRLAPWSLGEREAQDLMTILFGFMRRERAVEIRTDNAISVDWEELGLQARQMAVQLIKSRGGYALTSWAGKTTARAGFLKKILIESGLGGGDAIELADGTLRAIWEDVRRWGEQDSAGQGLLIRVGDAHRLNPNWWRVFPVRKEELLFQCDICNRLQTDSIRGICPRHKCPGRLTVVRSHELEENHYRLLYQENLAGRLRVEEHTAQIDKDKARDFQMDFKQNRIDVLSCSTTFELGVDLGDLDTVFLRNVPPEAFNYAQRVGRAGRRKGFPGIAVTYCRRAPHDFYHFTFPDQMLKGKTRPPALNIKNDKIILRHVAATVLSQFFREFRNRFERVGLLFKDLEQPSALADLREYLEVNRDRLEDSLSAIVPIEMADLIGLKDGTWIERVAGTDSRFSLAQDEVSSDYKQVKEVEMTSAQKGDYETAKWARARADTIAGDDVLSFLSRKAVIPKYGFPVDVVELDTHPVANRNREASEVSLQRDLAIAVAEFAPTSKLIANKKEWESKGLKRVTGKEWPQRFYKRCIRHNLFKQWGKGESEPADDCGCQMIEGCYIDPVFGFVTAKGGPEEPKRRPAKTFTTRPYFVGFNGVEPGETSFSGIQITKTSPGKMVVLCEGRRGEGFSICTKCGAGFRHLTKEIMKKHQTPLGTDCFGQLERHISLGHEFPTDVIRMQFTVQPPMAAADPIWITYSLAYAIVEGASEILEVPSSDLNATVAYSSGNYLIHPIILYDNVPGGAGLVARLEEKDALRRALEAALQRVDGKCKCREETSCYVCLRSYRNQFAHPYLKRGPAMRYLQTILSGWT